MDAVSYAMNLNGLNLLGIQREPQRQLGSYLHKDQMDIYGRRGEECDQYTKRYWFKKKPHRSTGLVA